jgi:hypothetical protein
MSRTSSINKKAAKEIFGRRAARFDHNNAFDSFEPNYNPSEYEASFLPKDTKMQPIFLQRHHTSNAVSRRDRQGISSIRFGL